ncbi:hypothetical protein LGZ99_17040 [Photorhabdus temperata]|uniref:hypothetical protein n=1 Tax=Photorhabdus temperata TaxID=574560 RepID=UPI000B2625FC|nr:hypothetical protein [Photorhabdus temperata]MCT8348844.1 hypothetical protein [Photorhabdus temperata]
MPRQASAYRTHTLLTEKSEAEIKAAIKTLKRLGQKPTKSAVARMTGLSRVHLSRRYSILFDG